MMGWGGVRPEHGPEWADAGRLWHRGVRALTRAARADERPTLHRMVTQHLGAIDPEVPVVSRTWSLAEQVNVQLALERWLAQPDRTVLTHGILNPHHQPFGLADLSTPEGSMMGVYLGRDAKRRVPSGPSGATHPVADGALHLLTLGSTPLALLQRVDPHERRIVLEILGPSEQQNNELMEELASLRHEVDVHRGQVIALEPDYDGGHPVRFLARPQVPAEDVVLPPGVLDSIRHHALAPGRHRDLLRLAGQHLRRGLLLHGPPGTGKTHTLGHLMSESVGTTTIVLTGAGLARVSEAATMARALQPAMVVLEDVDLVARERGPDGSPMLFELLNAMDGVGGDADITFVLTTNRADLLERALADRPGRVDQAVLLDVPDADGRLALIRLYQGTLEFALADGELEAVVEATAGRTASFFKELVRRAVLTAITERTEDPDGTGGSAATEPATSDAGCSPVSDAAMVVTGAHLRAAADDLLHMRNTLTRTLLGDPGSRPDPDEDADDVGETGWLGPRPGLYRGHMMGRPTQAAFATDLTITQDEPDDWRP